MRTKEFEAHHRASAKISQAMLLVHHLMLEGYGRTRNITAIWPEIAVFMVVRLNDHRRRPPISKNKIAKRTGIPRRTVDGYVENLIRHHAIMESDGGYVGDDSYIQARLNARYFKRVVRVFKAIARVLKDYK